MSEELDALESAWSMYRDLWTDDSEPMTEPEELALGAFAWIEQLRADKAARDAQLAEALREVGRYAREAGYARGRLEGSEIAGVVDGWREKCAALEADKAALVQAAREISLALPHPNWAYQRLTKACALIDAVMDQMSPEGDTYAMLKSARNNVGNAAHELGDRK